MNSSSRTISGKMDMLHGSLLDKILIFALPLAGCSIMQQLFNSVGIAVVGRFASSQSLAAVGGNGSIISLLLTLFSGISLGSNVVIAHYIGQGNEKKIPRVVHTAISLALVSGILLLLLGQMIARPILALMGTPSDVIDLATLYLRIYFLGMPFLMLYDFGASILRSIGDTKRPFYSLLASGVINVILNLLLVVVFHMDVAGTGIATVIANGVSAFLVLHFLMHENDPIRLSLKHLVLDCDAIMRIIRIGVPAGLQGMVFSLANVCIQSTINSFGSKVVAGSSAALNYEYFSYFLVNAFAQTTVTFTSQNYGAGEYDRCKKVFRLGMLASVLSCGCLSLIFVLFRSFFVGLYTTDSAVIHYALLRVLVVLTFECLTSAYEISGAALRGLGHSMTPAALTVLGSCILRLIWVFTLCRMFHSYILLLVIYPISWIVTGAMVLFAYFKTRKKLFPA